ncbi:MAG: hypothetical protein Q9191_002659 [Dirinaria sp. TL-2023a]
MTSCGRPQPYNASKEFAHKKVVLFAIKSKGVDLVIVIAYNDAWVMSAWGKANNVRGDDLLFMCDIDLEFSKKIGWTKGERTSRYAMIIDHGKITYAENEPGSDVTVTLAPKTEQSVRN